MAHVDGSGRAVGGIADTPDGPRTYSRAAPEDIVGRGRDAMDAMTALPLPGSTHGVIYESRPARCCGSHRERWAVCSCGWEAGEQTSDLGAAVIGHRLTVIEKAIGVTFRFGAKP